MTTQGGCALSNRTKLSDEQRVDWLRLIRSDNIGPRTFHDLVEHFGGVRAAARRLARPRTARRLGAADPDLLPRARRRGIEGCARCGVEFFALGEPDYPPRLQMIDDPPPVIAVRGQLDVLPRPLVAIVGSRNASAAGVKFAERMARDLGDAGFVVVSGLARGIDAAAHRASLATGTIAVLAGGHDRIYPAEHIGLLDKLLVDGAAVSEMPLAWEPRAQIFRAATGSSRGFPPA